MNKYIVYIILTLLFWSSSLTISADTVTVGPDGTTSTTTSTSSEARGSGGECVLSEIPAAMEVFRSNIDTLSQAVIDLTSGSACREPTTGSNKEWNKAIAIITGGSNVQRTYNKARTLGESIFHTLAGIDFYFRADNTAVPDYLLKHQNYLLEIDAIIGKAINEAGRRCGTGIEFSEVIQLEESIYSTAGNTAQTVLSDMLKNHRDITRFIRNLALGREQSRMDESLIPIAPIGFDEAMRGIYTQENINACEQAQPETKAIKELVKETMISGWKYDEAIKIWKEAFQMLVTRKSSESIGDGKNKDEPGNFIVRIAGGISRSGKLQSEEEKKGTGQSTNDRSFGEHVKTVFQNIAYIGQSTKNDRFSFTIRDVFSFLGGSNNDTQSSQEASTLPGGSDSPTAGENTTFTYDNLDGTDEALLEVVTTLVDLNRTYTEVQGSTLTPEGSQAAYDVAPLVDTIYFMDKILEVLESNMNLACDALQKEGNNIEPNSCADIKDAVLKKGSF